MYVNGIIGIDEATIESQEIKSRHMSGYPDKIT
jgi:hypothetical protein